MSESRTAFVAALCVASATAGSSSCKSRPASHEIASVHPRASASTAPASAPRAVTPLWRDAMGADPLAKARLAQSLGAAELMEEVTRGGELAQIALDALPFADDGEIALARLGELALARAGSSGGRSPSLGEVLEAILGIAGQPRRQREALDPGGAHACALTMVALAKQTDLGAEPRALALSAARALAERGYLEAALLPTEAAAGSAVAE